MMATKQLVSFRVVVDSKTVIPWSIQEVEEQDSFLIIFEKLKSRSSTLLEQVSPEVTSFVAASGADSAVSSEVSLNFPVFQCLEFGKYVTFRCKKIVSASAPQPAVSAFSMMMAVSQKLSLALPSKYSEKSDIRSDWKSQNDVIDMLEAKKLGFQNGCENTVGRQFVCTVSGVLYQLLVDERLQRLKERSLALPAYFSPLFEKRYNDPTKHKHGKLQPLTSAELQ